MQRILQLQNNISSEFFGNFNFSFKKIHGETVDQYNELINEKDKYNRIYAVLSEIKLLPLPIVFCMG